MKSFLAKNAPITEKTPEQKAAHELMLFSVSKENEMAKRIVFNMETLHLIKSDESLSESNKAALEEMLQDGVALYVTLIAIVEDKKQMDAEFLETTSEWCIFVEEMLESIKKKLGLE
jgi:hypothetical protein